MTVKSFTILGSGISTKESLAKSSWIQIDNFGDSADEIALKNARVNAPVTSSWAYLSPTSWARTVKHFTTVIMSLV
jgi:hypothetical protein